MVSIVARLLDEDTVAVRPATGPAATGPVSVTSVATSPLPTPARLLRSVTPPGAVQVRAEGPLSDHTDTTQLPAVPTVAAGVACDVPEASEAPVTEATGPVAAVPE
jgi:hypothetical protein